MVEITESDANTLVKKKLLQDDVTRRNSLSTYAHVFL